MLDYVAAICRCKTLDALWDIHCNAMNEFGFDRLLYGFTHFMTSNSFGPREDSLFLSSYDAEFMKLYKGEELYRHAPMILWALENTGACSWSWARDNYDKIPEEGRRVLKISAKMNVTAGYTIAFPETSKRARGVIALAAKPGLTQCDVDQIWHEHGKTIEAMNNVAHLKIISLPHQTDRTKLSVRQLEALEWVGDGKTNQDIATILGVTPATVEKHLRIAREKLGVETTAQAVLKISYLNQIHSPDS